MRCVVARSAFAGERLVLIAELDYVGLAPVASLRTLSGRIFDPDLPEKRAPIPGRIRVGAGLGTGVGDWIVFPDGELLAVHAVVLESLILT